MLRISKALLVSTALLFASVGIAGAGITSEPARVQSGLLTEPSTDAPRSIAEGYLAQVSDEYGLTSADLSDLVVKDEYRTAHNGVTHIYLRQRLNGIEVVNGDANVNIDASGRVFFAGNRFVSDLASAVNVHNPALGALEAIRSAADELGLPSAGVELLATEGGAAGRATFSRGKLSLDEIPARLMYLPTDDRGVRLVWEAVVRLPDHRNWYQLFVDAVTGETLEKFNWVAEQTEGDSSSYRVIPFPAESPYDSGQTLESEPADASASPFGWHDTDGSSGAEFTDTRGNNVFAQTDLDNNNNPAGETVPDGGAGLDFDFLWDPGLDPEAGTNKEAAVVNLFYWNNILHDVLYQYGFDEPSGNFQENNYGNGGLGGDSVNADALDGSGTNNANFATPPDGGNPRMQMYRWTNPFGQLVTINSPGTIAGDYVANPSNSGGTADGLTADMELVIDGVAPTDDACQTVTNDLTGKIALIRWSEGLCNSSVFVANAAAAGAVAAVIIDNQETPYTNFGGSSSIPSVAVGSTDGQLFVDTFPTTINATIDDNPSVEPDRDSDFDNGVIAHEYGHGVSNRLTGGPSNSGCLGHNEQAGEGWSDWMLLMLNAEASDTRTTIRGTGNYASFRPTDGDGIRNFPYTTDLAVNPQTYEDIGSTNIPHGVGEIWAAMLWEVYWNLVDDYGFDADFYNGTGGNNLAMQLVMDGLKLQPCVPTFVAARDAILAADVAGNGGVNECRIWEGFAKRGLGASAVAGGSGVGDETEAFDLPASCAEIFEDGFESGDTSAWSATVP